MSQRRKLLPGLQNLPHTAPPAGPLVVLPQVPPIVDPPQPNVEPPTVIPNVDEANQLGRVPMGYRGTLMNRYKVQTDGYGAGIWEGERLIGNWKDGKPHGEGTLYGDDFYSGQWVNGVRHGNGTTLWEVMTGTNDLGNPPRYIGTWKDGVPFEGKELDFGGNVIGYMERGSYHAVLQGGLVMTVRYPPYGRDCSDCG